jgi:hypothetical protein
MLGPNGDSFIGRNRHNMHSLRFPSIPSITFYKKPSVLDTIFSPAEVDEGAPKEEFSLKVCCSNTYGANTSLICPTSFLDCSCKFAHLKYKTNLHLGFHKLLEHDKNCYGQIRDKSAELYV